MDKKQIIQEVQAGLADELRAILNSAQSAHEAATHEESRAEDGHDTRGLEASYLATAQRARAAEIQRLMTIFKFFPVREFNSEDLVCSGALVELEYNGTRAFYFMVPQGGGWIARIDDKPVQVITPQSPMGEALMGRKLNDEIEIEMRSGTRVYKLVSIQ